MQVLDPKGEIARDVVQARICQLPQQFIDPEVRFRASAPNTLRCLAQLLQHAQRVQLTIRPSAGSVLTPSTI